MLRPLKWVMLRDEVEPFGDRRDCFPLSVAPPDFPGFPKLVTLSEREREGVENFARKFADIARTL
jgi:hypothetical protein